MRSYAPDGKSLVRRSRWVARCSGFTRPATASNWSRGSRRRAAPIFACAGAGVSRAPSTFWARTEARSSTGPRDGVPPVGFRHCRSTFRDPDGNLSEPMAADDEARAGAPTYPEQNPPRHCVKSFIDDSDDLSNVSRRGRRVVQNRRLFQLLVMMNTQRRERGDIADRGDGQQSAVVAAGQIA
jgi:hypothetical protein